jgi:hypothetical protein
MRSRPGNNRYDRGYGRSQRYQRDYDNNFGRYGTPFPGAYGYPSARWGWGPIGMAGWGMGMPFGVPYNMPWYGFGDAHEPPRRPPQESPSYGRGGDQAVRRWSQRYGYDMEYEIRPRPFPRR